MPKMKTNRGAAKRFRRTKNGKIKRNKAFARHLAQTKNGKRRRNLKSPAILSAADEKRIAHLLPYA